MNYSDIWNKIVDEYNKNKNKKEELVQRTWEMLFKFSFNYSDGEIDPQKSVKMGSTSKKADIVIKKDNIDIFIIELKRHTLHDGQEQLFSYLNQLKIDLGVLVCDNLYIYDYDFTTQNKFTMIEIPFEHDNPNGVKFVELFTKDNFDKQAIKNFINEINEKHAAITKIQNELSQGLIIELLKKHFIETMEISENEVKNVLQDYNISITKNTNTNIATLSPSCTQSFSKNSACKDNTQYTVNGEHTGGKGPTVYATVKLYIESNNGIGFEELKQAFPDHIAKPGFGKMIRRYEEVSKKEWEGSRFNKEALILSDGTKVAVSTQWTPNNMKTFIDHAATVGIDIKPIEN